MARTVRTYWNDEGRLVKDHRDGRTGWLPLARTAIDAEAARQRRADRRLAMAEAWAEVAEGDEIARLVAEEVGAMLDRLAA